MSPQELRQEALPALASLQERALLQARPVWAPLLEAWLQQGPMASDGRMALPHRAHGAQGVPHHARVVLGELRVGSAPKALRWAQALLEAPRAVQAQPRVASVLSDARALLLAEAALLDAAEELPVVALQEVRAVLGGA